MRPFVCFPAAAVVTLLALVALSECRYTGRYVVPPRVQPLQEPVMRFLPDEGSLRDVTEDLTE